jgi:uncharacterized membrane protein (DUF106 family)
MYSLFAQQAEPRWLEFVSRPEALVFLIPIVAILVGGIISITKKLIHHRERMAMIERGMHPDFPPEQCDPQEKV